MSALLHPEGPESSGVYWRRRILVAIAAVVVLALVAWVVIRFVVGDPKPKPTASATGVAACAAADLTVATTGPKTVATDETATFTTIVKSTKKCTMDGSAKSAELVISAAGADVYTTAQCPVDAAPKQMVIEAGGQLTITSTWDKTLSAENCPTDRAAAEAGDYSATVTVLTVAGDPVAFTLAG